MFGTLLVANRGEIACRIMRTAARMGIRTIGVYSAADAHAQHVRQADAAVCVGAAPASESYLNIGAVLEAARATNRSSCLEPESTARQLRVNSFSIVFPFGWSIRSTCRRAQPPIARA